VRLRKLYSGLKSVKRSADRVYLNGFDAIRIEYDGKRFCPLTAIVRDQCQMVLKLSDTYEAAESIGVSERVVEIVRAADNASTELGGKGRRIRRAMLRALGLEERS
jgi:hypothetical protein